MENQNEVFATILLEEPVYNYGHCRSNCVDILSDRNSKVMTNNITTKVPDVMLANVMSLVPKIDEVTEFIVRNKINLSLITETWLKESVPDSVIDISGFTLLRRDRLSQIHGGVCAYIKETHYKYKRLDDLNCCDDHECLWIYLRPTRLPRGLTCIITSVIYHPPGADGALLLDHLFYTLTLAESKYPNCGIIVTGDFNRLDVTRLLNHFRLKQIVKIPTRNDVTLDLILTNMHKCYNSPQGYPGFGLSDHNTIIATGKNVLPNANTKKLITVRDTRKSRKLEMGRYLTKIDWSLVCGPLDTCESMWTSFHELVHSGLDIIMPEKQIRIHPTDAPWMTQKLKSLILSRQKAFHVHGAYSPQFKHYRNRVNRERKVCRAKYYESHIKQLKGEASRKWWNEVKQCLVNKVGNLDIPRSVVNWIIDFLSHRTQRVKLAKGCFSKWGPVPSGVPQGTKLGQWLFILMIQDLNINSPYLWKFVDDTTASEILAKGSVSTAQNIADHVMQWSEENKLQLHPAKCKELRISFSQQPVVLDQVTVNGKEIELVDSAKLLGVTISNNLTWNAHIKEVIKKARKRLYYLVQLKRARLPVEDLVTSKTSFYTSCVRSVMDYAVPAFYHALPQYLKNDLIRLEKRAISIINPDVDYLAAGEVLDMKLVEEHHNLLCKNFFDKIINNANHKLADLLPKKHNSNYALRSEHKFNLPQFKTNHTRNSFVIAMASKM